MSREPAPYHHGDLRTKLIEAAIAGIETEGASKLSLRKIAGQMGVSHNAPYMHFASKDALLAAVVDHGFAQLRTEIAKAGGRETFTKADWPQRVKRGFRAYVAFARKHPGLYAVMHIPKGKSQGPPGRDSHKGDTAEAGTATLRGLAATLEAGQRLGHVRAGDAEEIAFWVWATLHGLSSLAANDRVVFAGRSPDTVSELVLDQLIQALAN